MSILAVDTTKKAASIFIIDDTGNKIHTLKDDEKQSEFLMTTIDEFLKENGLELSQIECFGVVVGPGSFTGIRVGIATVKAFAYALDKKTISCSVFDVVKDTIKNGVFLCECTSNSFYFADIVNGQISKVGVIDREKVSMIQKEIFVLEEEHILVDTAYKLNVLKNYPNLCCNKFCELFKLDNYSSPDPYYIQLSQAERNLEKKND